jgi:hypothetical protein
MFKISCRLINIISNNNNSSSNSSRGGTSTQSEKDAATEAFLILPGLVGECHLHRKLTVASLLSTLAQGVDTIDSNMDFAKSIVIQAESIAHLIQDRREKRRRRHDIAINHNNNKKEKTIKKIEAMIRERRLGTAMAYLDKLQDILEEDSNEIHFSERGEENLDINHVRSKVAELNPAADEEDIFSAEEESRILASESLSIEANQIEAAIRKLPIGAAAGGSGWTYAAIRAIFLEDNSTIGLACSAISRLCNSMLSGSIRRGEGWLRSRTVLIPKKDGSWRPLSIGETWYRLTARVALGVVGAQVGLQLAPMQLGCGISGGCEIAGRLGQIILDTESGNNLIVISLDIQNAYGTLSRRQILKGLFDFAPGLAKWFKWAYGSKTPLVYGEGQIVGWNSTGCRQGDPLSALCFCVGIQDLLREISECVDNIKTRVVQCSSIGGVYSYIDDINIFVDGRVANAVAEEVKEIFLRHRLSLSEPKCRFLVNEESVLDIDEELGNNIFRIENDGMVLLGNPTGSNNYRQNEIRKIVQKAGKSIPALSNLLAWSRWNLLRHCITAKLGYIARVSEFELGVDSFRNFDRKVDDAVLKMAKVGGGEDDEDTKNLVKSIGSLPLALGGLGIPRLAGVTGETACLLSRQMLYEFLEQFNPVLLSGAISKWSPISLGSTEEGGNNEEFDILGSNYFYSGGESDGVARRPSLVLASGEETIREEALNSGESLSMRRDARIMCRFVPEEDEARNARAIKREISSRRAKEIVKALHEKGRVAEATWFNSSQFKGSGRWLAGPGGQLYGKYAFRNNDEYVAALRMRLLLSPASSGVSDSRGAVMCKCGMLVDLKERPFHALDCSGSQWFHIHRHNAVRDTLEEFLKKYCPENTSIILKEPKVAPLMETVLIVNEAQIRNRNVRVSQSVREFRLNGQNERRSGDIRADIGILSALRRQYIDVVVVNPAAESYRTIRDETTGVQREAELFGQSFAVEHRLEAKKRRYRPILGDTVDDPNFFVPFIVEATGKLGHHAEQLIQAVALEAGTSWARSLLINQIGATIARNNAMMAQAWMRPLLRQTSSRL